MNLDFDTEETAICDAIAAALKRATGDRLRQIWGTGYLDQEYRDLGEMGMFSFVAGEPPDESDPSRSGAVESCILAEQLGLHSAVTPVVTSVVQVAGTLRTVDGHADSVASLTSAQEVWSWANLETSSRPDSHPTVEGEWSQAGLVLSGEKAFVEWGSLAKRFVVTAAVAGERSLLLVPADAPGISITPRRTNTGGSLTRVIFRGTPVEEDAVLARGDAAAELIHDAWRRTLLFQSAYLVGIGRRAIDLTIAHAKVREQFGRQLGAFQAVKHALADVHIALLASRLMVFETASRAGFSSPLGSLAAMKAWIAETTTTAVRVAHEIHGGLGAVDDHEVTLLFRRALAETQLYGSASELWQVAAEARADHGAGNRRFTNTRRENAYATRS